MADGAVELHPPVEVDRERVGYHTVAAGGVEDGQRVGEGGEVVAVGVKHGQRVGGAVEEVW